MSPHPDNIVSSAPYTLTAVFLSLYGRYPRDACDNRPSAARAAPPFYLALVIILTMLTVPS
jgi:hypothetical protein